MMVQDALGKDALAVERLYINKAQRSTARGTTQHSSSCSVQTSEHIARCDRSSFLHCARLFLRSPHAPAVAPCVEDTLGAACSQARASAARGRPPRLRAAWTLTRTFLPGAGLTVFIYRDVSFCHDAESGEREAAGRRRWTATADKAVMAATTVGRRIRSLARKNGAPRAARHKTSAPPHNEQPNIPGRCVSASRHARYLG